MRVVDSHTGGEPTRVILDGGPDLGSGPLSERAARLAADHVTLYRSILVEPRGQPAMVGALLTEPTDPSCAAGVIYFDAGAVIGMCGHGTIGLTVTLAHLGRIGVGRHKIETPAGIVEVDLKDANTVTLTNIESRRIHADVPLDVDGVGQITGDIAYGGNWFYIVEPSPIAVTPANIPALTEETIAIRRAAHAAGIGGERGEPIDHVIFQAPSPNPEAHGRSFVLCPDDAYDRSPCGTGSSAMLACLAASGRLAEGAEIIQESVIGSAYRLSYRKGQHGGVIPTVTGSAHVMAEGRLIFGESDPFKDGITL